MKKNIIILVLVAVLVISMNIPLWVPALLLGFIGGYAFRTKFRDLPGLWAYLSRKWSRKKTEKHA